MTETPLRATISLRGVVFDTDETVLVVKRASDRGWELPGGRLGAHEACRAGLEREIREETSLEPAVREPVHTVSWRNDADNGRFAVYYRCDASERAVTLSAEHVGHSWVSEATARDRLSDPQATAVERALDADTSSMRTSPAPDGSNTAEADVELPR
ncbi:ADP-ribose pyrophosphatase [Halosimplex carlsbadense 2-9-1]|uniref:ADP-ribose pyrophosphatase n=1 Tax=Halosimplex carlsbadense 2-9-1 TaxID=797114 RepID=M0D649_9EURY|nr:NUDIX domain-containing protein [Halosimplex carlsbadense]ELZ30333.1 ADP-ribose pyrophosphatase [Halosimplex carlsbadense 2-9-1]